MQTIVVIPARLGATRLPGKPLLDLGGKPIVQHVYERAREARCASRVLVATDDARVLEAVAAFGGEAVLTSEACASGTDRVAEALRKLEARGDTFGAVVNVQGDEPFVSPRAIEAAAAALSESTAPGRAPIATLSRPLGEGELDDLAVVKVVTGRSGHALYFSRAPIGRDRDTPARAEARAHVGLYAFTRDALFDFAALEPTPLERSERLEQLRALEHGRAIAVAEIDHAAPGIDTPGDLERARAHLASQAP